MKPITERVRKVWDEQRLGPCSLATVDTNGTPNVIYAGTVCRCDKGFLIANYHFDKTLANLKANPRAALLFFTQEQKAYQVKGTISFHSEGPLCEAMAAHIRTEGKLPCDCVVLLTPTAAFCGAEQL